MGRSAAGEQSGESVDVEPVVVERHRRHLGLEAGEAHGRAEIGRRLDEHRVAGIEEDRRSQLHRLDPAARDEQLALADGHAFLRLDPPGEEVAQPGQAVVGRVLERREVARRADVRHHRRQGLAVECLGVGEPAGERDDVGAAGEGHDRRDLGAEAAGAGAPGEQVAPGARCLLA